MSLITLLITGGVCVKLLIKLLSKLHKKKFLVKCKKFNTKFSVKDDRDFCPNFVSMVKIPDSFEIKNRPVIRQQGVIGSCFPGRMKVLMEDFSYKNISDVNIGEYVITHKGNKKKVTSLFKRKWQGTMIKISSFGNFIPIECTPEHPIYTSHGWKNAKNITSKDMVFFPVSKIERDTFIYEIEKDKDFLWLLGLYIAEGNIETIKDSKRCTLSLNHNELDIAIRVSKILSKFDIDCSVINIEEHKTLRIRFSNKFLVSLLEELGGKLSKYKKLHSRLMCINKELQMEIFKGWEEGDGNKNFIKNRHSVTTISEVLANQMQQILMRNNIFATLISRKSVDRQRRYDVLYVENSSDSYRRKKSNDGFFVKITKVEKILQNMSSYVYNLEVEEDNSYIVEGRAVHNCASHAVIRAFEIQLISKDYFIEGSERFHYYVVRKEVNDTFPSDDGMSIRDACKGLTNYGMSIEYACPYVTSKFNVAPSWVAYSIANLFQVDRYERLETVWDIKKSISEGVPVVCGILIDDNYMKLKGRGCVWNFGGKTLGGHAQLIYSYDDAAELFGVDNSWGTSWGDKGSYYVKYNDLLKMGFDFFRVVIK